MALVVLVKVVCRVRAAAELAPRVAVTGEMVGTMFPTEESGQTLTRSMRRTTAGMARLRLTET